MTLPGQRSTTAHLVDPSMRPRPARREPTLVALAVAGLALASCGSDSGEGATAPEVPADDSSDVEAEAEDARTPVELGSGGGLVTVDGVDYSFDAVVCYSQDFGFEASGPGQTADGVPYWASVTTGVSTREDMVATGIPEANVDAFFGDKDAIESFGIQIELGKADQFGSGDDSMPDLRIDAIDAEEFDGLDYTVEGSSISGSGALSDDNGVAVDFGETAPFTFSASCNE